MEKTEGLVFITILYNVQGWYMSGWPHKSSNFCNTSSTKSQSDMYGFLHNTHVQSALKYAYNKISKIKPNQIFMTDELLCKKKNIACIKAFLKLFAVASKEL